MKLVRMGITYRVAALRLKSLGIAQNKYFGPRFGSRVQISIPRGYLELREEYEKR